MARGVKLPELGAADCFDFRFDVAAKERDRRARKQGKGREKEDL